MEQLIRASHELAKLAEELKSEIAKLNIGKTGSDGSGESQGIEQVPATRITGANELEPADENEILKQNEQKPGVPPLTLSAAKAGRFLFR